MWTHWSADWELLFGAQGHYWKRDYPALVLCTCMGECITQLLVTAHTPRLLTLDLQQLHKCARIYTRARTQSTYSGLHNQHGPNDCLHWLPSLCNYVPIVYFLASYSFKRNSIIIALFNVKVNKSGGCGAPGAVLSLSVSVTHPRLLCFTALC